MIEIFHFLQLQELVNKLGKKHFIHGQTSSDIPISVNDFDHYVQNYFQYVYLPIYPQLVIKISNDLFRSWRSEPICREI